MEEPKNLIKHVSNECCGEPINSKKRLFTRGVPTHVCEFLGEIHHDREFLYMYRRITGNIKINYMGNYDVHYPLADDEIPEDYPYKEWN